MTEEAKKTEVVNLRPLSASTALASSDEWRRELGRWQALIRSGGLPKHIRTPEMAIAIVRVGETFGWDSMRALRSIHMVEGRPELAAEAMLSLIREHCPDALVYPVEMTDRKVTIRVKRPPQVPEAVDVTVTREQFEHLIRPTKSGAKSVWQLYTADMLWARCVSRVARRIFPDVTAGAYTLGEVEEAQRYTTRQIGTKEIAMPGEDVEQVIEAEVEDQRPEVEPEDESQDPEPETASRVDTEPPDVVDAADVPGEPPEDASA
jgi:hypothetical protein